LEGSPLIRTNRLVNLPALSMPSDLPSGLGDQAPARAARSDEELAASARAGSLEALEELVRRYQVPLLRFLRRGPCPREAEDVLQEAWLRAMRSLDAYRPGRPFKPWIFTIAYRLAVDAARKRSPASLEAVESSMTTPARALGPAERVERAEWAERFWAAVRQALGDEGFAAAWLHYGESMPPREVAAVLGRSQVWVRTTLYRSRKRLSRLFERATPLARNSGDSIEAGSYDLVDLGRVTAALDDDAR
jgi:RNA polymerase sigma-70 factor, ECF subfamily